MVEQKADFESIKYMNPYSVEYWSARELAPLLGYAEWRNFDTVAIAKAKIACEKASQEVANHFVDATKMVPLGSGSERSVNDYHLSRFACYLTAMNGDPRKPEIAAAQTYFAVNLLQFVGSWLLSLESCRKLVLSRENRAANQAALLSLMLVSVTQLLV